MPGHCCATPPGGGQSRPQNCCTSLGKVLWQLFRQKQFSQWSISQWLISICGQWSSSEQTGSLTVWDLWSFRVCTGCKHEFHSQLVLQKVTWSGWHGRGPWQGHSPQGEWSAWVFHGYMGWSSEPWMLCFIPCSQLVSSWLFWITISGNNMQKSTNSCLFFTMGLHFKMWYKLSKICPKRRGDDLQKASSEKLSEGAVC